MKNNKVLNIKTDLLLILAFVFFGLIPLSSQKVEVVLMLLFTLFIVIHAVKTKTKIKFKKGIFFLLNASLFFILFLSLIDGVDVLIYKKIEQMCSLLVFPFIFLLLSKQGLVKNKALLGLWKKVFVASTFVLTIICFFIIGKYSNPRYPNLDSNFFQNAILDNYYFSKHPAYISIYLNISILLSINWLVKSRKKIEIFVYSLIIVTLSVLLFMLSVKIAIIALAICVTVFLFLRIKQKLFFIVGLLSLTLVLVTLLPEKYNRFRALFNTSILNKNVQYNSVFIHKQTIICATKIFKDNFVFGIGIENSNTEVDKCVRQVYTHEPDTIYNSHNQYLSYGLHSGVLGFFLLCFVVYVGLRLSFFESPILFILLLYFSIIFFTENVLERQSGLLMFAFLLNIIPNLSRANTLHKNIYFKW